MVDDLKQYAEEYYTDAEFAAGCRKYTHARPFTKESLLYRELFEKVLSGTGGDDRRLLDAQQGMGGL